MKERFLLRHLLQILGAIILATGFSIIPFFFEFELPEQNSFAITVFLVFVLVFEINTSIAKHRDLKRNINLELSRVRRVHHLVENMSTKRMKWFEDIDDALLDYLLSFKKQSFDAYFEKRDQFRKITHLIYSFKPNNRREEVVFIELLATTRELAETRQNIVALLRQHISPYQWVVVLVIEILVVISSILTQGTGITNFLLHLSLLSSIFIVTLLIWEVDDYNPDELQQFADAYVKNIKSIRSEKKRKKA